MTESPSNEAVRALAIGFVRGYRNTFPTLTMDDVIKRIRRLEKEWKETDVVDVLLMGAIITSEVQENGIP